MHFTNTTAPAIKRIALVAHDNMKPVLARWCKAHETILKDHQLWATGTTGSVIEHESELVTKRLLSGPMGGDQQIGAFIAEQKIDVLIFFWDPLASMPHDPDIKALLRIAAVWNIPVACNPASADLLVSSPLLNKAYEYRIPDYSAYEQNRNA
ncbi:MAG: methylglyoxal synthase [Glaciecola sp.]|jgi:methylglyoxal synthase